MKKQVIYDGDMGGDDLWAIALLLAHREKIDILGIATVFGNVSIKQATKVTLGFLNWLKVTDIEVAQGLSKARDNINPLGDNAFGEDGVGGVIFPEHSLKAHSGDIAAWYKMKLDAAKKPVTIIATGPLTNIAYLLSKYPAVKKKIREVIWMGAALHPPGKNGKPVFKHGIERSGNITMYAEFNAYMDPQAANEVIKSKVLLTIMPMDATQNMVLTKPRQKAVQEIHKTYGADFFKMQMVVADLDKRKFGVPGPFIHDPNTVVYYLSPGKYKARKMPVLSFLEAKPSNEYGQRGRVVLKKLKGNVKWVGGVKDEKGVFAILKKGIAATIENATAKPAKSPKRPAK